jgi:hypothetical protein
MAKNDQKDGEMYTFWPYFGYFMEPKAQITPSETTFDTHLEGHIRAPN